MDAVKFLKEFKRMCNTHDGCGNCPVEERCNFLCIISDEERQEIVGIVEKWSKDHPPKTRLQDFLEKYPNADMEKEGIPDVCCAKLGYNCSCHKYSCIDCWNEALEE